MDRLNLANSSICTKKQLMEYDIATSFNKMIYH